RRERCGPFVSSHPASSCSTWSPFLHPSGSAYLYAEPDEDEQKTMQLTTRVAQPVRRTADRLFYMGMAIASLVAVFIGFAPTYYLKGYFQGTPLTPLVHLHGLVFTGWMLLFVTQTALVAGHRTDLHRRLGCLGAVWAPLLVLVGTTTAVVSARRNFAAGHVEALTFLAVPLGDMLVFAVLAAAGLCYRRRAETHKRLMLLATVALLDAAVARWPLAIVHAGPAAFFLVADLFVVAGFVYD